MIPHPTRDLSNLALTSEVYRQGVQEAHQDMSGVSMNREPRPAELPKNIEYLRRKIATQTVAQLKEIVRELRRLGNYRHSHNLTGTKEVLCQRILTSLRESLLAEDRVCYDLIVVEGLKTKDPSFDTIAKEFKQNPELLTNLFGKSVLPSAPSVKVPPPPLSLTASPTPEPKWKVPPPPGSRVAPSSSMSTPMIPGLAPYSGVPNGNTTGSSNSDDNSSFPISFKSSVFFEPLKAIANVTELPRASPGDRSVATCRAYLSSEDCTKLARNKTSSTQNSKYQVRLFCCSEDYYMPHREQSYPYSKSTPAQRKQPRGKALNEFPTMCEVRVNGVLITGNLKGLKKKSGTAPPLNLGTGQGGNITLRLTPGVVNNIEMVYANTEKRMYMLPFLVSLTSVSELSEKLKSKSWPVEKVLKDIKSTHDDEVEEVRTEMSLRCPLSYIRIKLPARSCKCRHLQCFDAESFLSMMEQMPTWNCPVCGMQLDYDDMILDGYSQSILKTIPSTYDSVILEPDTTWHTEDNRYGNSTSVSSNTHANEDRRKKQRTTSFDHADDKEMRKRRSSSSRENAMFVDDDEDDNRGLDTAPRNIIDYNDDNDDDGFEDDFGGSNGISRTTSRGPSAVVIFDSSPMRSPSQSLGNGRSGEFIDLTLSSDED